MENSNLLWALEENAFSQMVVNQQSRALAGHRRRQTITQRVGGIAIIYAEGVLSPAGEYGGGSLQEIAEAVRDAAADPNITAIVLGISSPGGTVVGTLECGNAIFEARAAKPIVAQVSSMAASAAFWLASQCHSVVAGPLDLVGSIGVFSILHDRSEAFKTAGIRPVILRSGQHKGVGVPGAPVTDAQAEHLQSLVNEAHAAFVAVVVKGRGASASKVASWADGRAWHGATAKTMGMVDGVQSIETTLAVLTRQQHDEQRACAAPQRNSPTRGRSTATPRPDLRQAAQRSYNQ